MLSSSPSTPHTTGGGKRGRVRGRRERASEKGWQTGSRDFKTQYSQSFLQALADKEQYFVKVAFSPPNVPPLLKSHLTERVKRLC